MFGCLWHGASVRLLTDRLRLRIIYIYCKCHNGRPIWETNRKNNQQVKKIISIKKFHLNLHWPLLVEHYSTAVMDWSQHSLGWNLEEGKVQFLRQTNFGGGSEWMLMIGNYSAAKLSSRNNFGYFGFREEGSQVISQWRADFVHKAVIQPKPSPHWRGLPRKHLIKAPALIIYSQNQCPRKLKKVSISSKSVGYLFICFFKFLALLLSSGENREWQERHHDSNF